MERKKLLQNQTISMETGGRSIEAPRQIPIRQQINLQKTSEEGVKQFPFSDGYSTKFKTSKQT